VHVRLFARLTDARAVPNNKTTPVATFVNSSVVFGAITRSFTRPFASSSGLTLLPDNVRCVCDTGVHVLALYDVHFARSSLSTLQWRLVPATIST
jgi:hypothetical protein